MPAGGGESPGRKPRADAQRNRAHLLDVAKSAFAEKGSAASLDEIARRAGVGIGTLYRHFPTRDALIEAVYRNEVEQLGEAASRLAAECPPVEALRAWLLLFVEYLGTKRGMSEALDSLVGGASELRAASGEMVKRSVAMLAGRASGELRLDFDPLDLLRALAGVANMGSGPDWRRSAGRLVDVLIAGLRADEAG
ncbi:HTH-type transcriptional regulator AcrR [Aquisphaera giovannonii]|uniref:HTH-type transcriptional regulator AcrR n=1 Tax=Aquisphaera giovannonii TaxID=406548 RepID=A0A5B9W2V0_9BACT|nr:TetR/AcrR family transcriptional regulator [Aquisphaera giovannonii]QEH34953.1 HTH-type transcriptional regulator AcrR [Aquisphaera giovannonii]